MIDIRKLAQKAMLIGALAATGCASSVKPEEFSAYKTRSEAEFKSIREEFAAMQKKALMDADARHDALIKEIEALNARLSVSSIDNYATGLEEQATQNAHRYAQLARTIAGLQKKEWDLGDNTARELAKIRSDSKNTDDSLAASLADLRKLFDDTKKAYDSFKKEEFQVFKEQNLQESEAHQKRAEAFEKSLAKLAGIIQQLEKGADVSKILEPLGETKTFVFTGRAVYESPLTYAIAMEQWRMEVAYRKANGEFVQDDALTRIYRFARVAGQDNTIQRSELQTDALEAKITELRRKDGEAYKELTMRALTITDKAEDTASIRVLSNDKQQEERLKKLREYGTNEQKAYIASMLNLHVKDGTATNEKLDYILGKVAEKYGK